MSMNATDSVYSACATFRATVDFPDPDPPATPMMSGFIGSSRTGSFGEQIVRTAGRIEAVALSQSGIDR